MAPEVISLLSSPAITVSAKPVSTQRIETGSKSRASVLLSENISSDVFDLTEDSPNGPSTLAKRRTSPGRANPGNLQTSVHSKSGLGDDFFILSDDFDTTGDLPGPPSKKPRTSYETAQKESGFAPARRDESGAQVSERPGALQSAGLRRWNSVADPIENSSSPFNGPARGKLNIVSDDFPSDPFASSPPKKIHAQPIRRSPRGHQGNRNVLQDSYQKDPVINNRKDNRKSAAWDPISSSAPEVVVAADVFESSPPKPRNHHHPIEIDDSETLNTDDEFPDLDNLDYSKAKAGTRLPRRSPLKRTKSAGDATKKSAEMRNLDRREKAEAREAEKERKKVEKEQARVQKTLAKEKEKALLEVNKLRTDKKVSTPEMIVDLPAQLNPALMVQIETLLKDIDVQHEKWQCPEENVIKWRRKVSCRFNEELGHWEPTPMQIKPEKHVLVVLTATHFVQLVQGPEGEDIEAYVSKMKSSFPRKTIIYLIEGLTPWMRKNRNIRNRQFASAVRNLDPGAEDAPPSTNQARRRRAAQPQEYIDEDSVEDALLSLQVVHGGLIHHTNLAVESAQWISVFTQHISTIPYRRARDAAADAGFCMESGQVRTGDGPRDTYVRMLQEITRVTAPIAYGVASKYETVRGLVQGLERDGPLALEACHKSANKDGAFTDRTIGQAVSRRIHKIFTGRDEKSTDV